MRIGALASPAARAPAALLLTLPLLALMTVASALGLARPDLYRDPTWIAAGWLGNDLITLVVAVPALGVALAWMLHGSRGARFLWLGLLDYAVYNGAFYALGAEPGRLFVVHLATFVLAAATLVYGLVTLAPRRAPGAGPRWPSAYMLVVALGLGGMWIAQAIGLAITGDPHEVAGSARAFAVVATLDLTLVVVPFLLAARWLRHGHRWGHPLAVITNVKGATYCVALLASSVTAADAGAPGSIDLVPLWAMLALGSTIAAAHLLWPPRRP